MKVTKILLASCLLVCAGVASAGGLENSEVVPMAYVSLPLGGQPARDTELSYGFGVSMAEVDEHEGLNFMQGGKSRLVDFSFTDDEFTALKFNGVNAMERTLVHNADGGTSSAMLFNPNFIVPAAMIGGTLILHWLSDGVTPSPSSPSEN